MADVDDGSSVTLVFYRVADKWWSEPWLNVVAAAAQFSSLTHVELAIVRTVQIESLPLEQVDDNVCCFRRARSLAREVK